MAAKKKATSTTTRTSTRTETTTEPETDRAGRMTLIDGVWYRPEDAKKVTVSNKARTAVNK